MKYGKSLLLMATLVTPAMAWAGEMVTRAAPTLGETGLIALGVGLLGVAAASLRRR